MKSLYSINIPGGHGIMKAVEKEGKICVVRVTYRSQITNTLDHYEEIQSDGSSRAKEFTPETARLVLDRVAHGTSYSSAFVFSSEDITDPIGMDPSELEHKFTSTGAKFWQHQRQMESYLTSTNNSVISTHVSPEGQCNLRCPFCSVTYRDTHSRIPLDTIKKYVENLQTRGLKAVILTGGGEPTLYPCINELVRWLKQRRLSIALITNGTQTQRVDDDVWGMFSWVRISINMFDGWEEKITLPVDKLNSGCTVGCSMIYTTEHQSTSSTDATDRVEVLRKAAKIADRVGAVYVRLLPNCLLERRELLLMHRAMDKTLTLLGDSRFFHQHKIHEVPTCDICHQAYFRPYLSEEKFHANGQPGTVYPCDSVVLNDSYQHFAKEYQICHADDILKFLDGEIKMQFNPKLRCSGCVFTRNVNMLDDWKTHGIGHKRFQSKPITHAEFI